MGLVPRVWVGSRQYRVEDSPRSRLPALSNSPFANGEKEFK